jgi:hypothetical protein
MGCVLGELVLRAFMFAWITSHPPANYAPRSGTLSRLVYANTLGHRSTLSYDCNETVYDPHRGYRPAPGLRDVAPRGVPLSTNSRGMRGVREYLAPKPAGVHRIVVLGDSQTWGDSLPDDATWPSQLERMSGIEVANLGVRGYAHDQMYFALVDDGIALQPDAVILGFYGDDLVRNDLTFFFYEKPRFSLLDGQWRVENLPVPTPGQVLARWFATPSLYSVPRALLEFYRSPDGPHYDPSRGREILGRVRQTAENAGARFILVNLPELMNKEPDRFFREHCASTGAECVDTAPLFRTAAGTDDPARLSERYLLPHDPHFSAAGCTVIAEAVHAYLAVHPLVP